MQAENTTKNINLIATMPLFEGVPLNVLHWVNERCEIVRVFAGQTLLDPARRNDAVYIIISGFAQVRNPGQEDQALAYLMEGQCVGEMSVIDGGQPSARVVADSDCKLLVIESATLWELIGMAPVVARNLMRTLSSRLRYDNEVILESLRMQRAFEHDARVDPLTGMHNRRWLCEMLDRQIQRCSISGEALSILMLDVDHFKHYNDTHGHLAGDCALQAVAQAIRSGLRVADTTARFGGEEFVALFPGVDIAAAHGIAEQLRQAVREYPVLDFQGRSLPGVTVSIGLTALAPGQGRDQLLNAVDAALYRAKHAGRDRISE
ncbi:diguanylate cyclase [Thiohalobacter sp. COW1]|uniref:diguanylate cyclase n=1 Tax=Thiohalobacter thiocyanaticus TaxID=585455 RepID=A0A1Z4VRQ8_9GAMM|nr:MULTISPECIES: GGDEF domain-containing protein [Thiohalobacter]BAZ94316.1 cyclic nucleotide-binding protein [Thiohalobacter thiocyanaticus]BCO30616.1 diguanylate cyclase [Thiohalobacter sp. COW1]